MKKDLLASFIVISLVIWSCEPFKKSSVMESEMINQVKLTLTSTTDTIVSNWTDLDGPGGNLPILPDTIKLKLGQTYQGTIQISSTVNGQLMDATNEIRTNSNAHLFCFDISSLKLPTPKLSIIRTDRDSKGLEIGLQTEWNTGASTDSGMIWVHLKHQPSIKNGSCDIGETDIEVQFPYSVR